MNCITNWASGTSSFSSKSEKTTRFEINVTQKINKASRNVSLSRTNQLLAEEEVPALQSEPSSVPATTLLGPPKQYYGDSSEDRYAYLLFEAITLIHRYGFETNVSSLQQMRTQADNNRGHKKRHRRIPGLLGFLLSDMDARTEIAVFESNGDPIARLGFRTYKQPWLCLHCFPAESSDSVDMLQGVLSRKFFLIRVPHTTQCFPFPLVQSPSPRGSNTEIAIGPLEVEMTTGNVAPIMAKSPYQDRLWTKFVVIESGQTVAFAFWSYTNDRLDFVGPAMEVFETVHGGPKKENLGLILSYMEEKIIEIVAPLVAFRVRLCKVDDPRVKQWLLMHGYAKTGEDNGFCKAFVVF